MSDKPIGLGDLVQVIKPASCGCSTAVGLTRTVVGFVEKAGRCAGCGMKRPCRLTAVLDGDAPWSRWHIEPHRLKRIPPLDELGSEKRGEEITA